MRIYPPSPVGKKLTQTPVGARVNISGYDKLSSKRLEGNCSPSQHVILFEIAVL